MCECVFCDGDRRLMDPTRQLIDRPHDRRIVVLTASRSATSAKSRVALLLSIILVGCTGTAQRPNLNLRSSDDDPAYKEIKKLVEDQSNCFKREALSKSVTTVDARSGANAAIRWCGPETARFKAYSAAHYTGSAPQFEQYWAEEESKYMEFLKEMIAAKRTQ